MTMNASMTERQKPLAGLLLRTPVRVQSSAHTRGQTRKGKLLLVPWLYPHGNAIAIFRGLSWCSVFSRSLDLNESINLIISQLIN